MNSKIRVRFAPSPTGPLHIGGVRTALYNYLFAKQNGGDFILRIEDTDSSRFVQGAEEYIEEAFSWLGLHFDESPSVGGQFGPYRQSERKDIYRKYVDYLLENDKAYIAFDTPEELDAKRNEIPNFQYDAQTRSVMRNSLTLDGATTQKLIEAGAQYVVRIKIDADIDIKVNDLIRGEVVINSSVLDDKVIYKSADELPTYHLANVVDDHLMKITHVIRGEEWLPSAPLHVWLYRSLQWEDTMPQFAHLPLLLKPDGNGKLSKRDGDRLGFPVFPLEWKDPVSGEISSGYRESGYLPQAVINMLALLGWNPGTEQEVFSLKELVDIFSFARCSKSGAKFDAEKAKWFNHHYIQCLPIEELADSVMPVLKEKGIVAENDKIETILQLIKERMNFIDDFWNQASFFFVSPESYAEKTVKKFWKNDTASQIESLRQLLQQTTDFSSANLEQMIKEWITNNNFKMGNIMNALRLSIVGESKGPHLFDILHLIGKDESIHRINMAIKNLHPTS